MKKELSPGMIAGILVVVLAVAAFFLYKGTGSNVPEAPPIDMGKMMGKQTAAPPGGGR